ncbi:SH3 domain-containing protein [Amycolatopsis sp. FBCC-B4732]|uniref:SH3 domain-containing protein n=1 Tax=Amycolatopsis sp. FBCC-B4732 TaxID=3079339 RepID=UPI001FF6D2EA|nr:SH3 domain-containing protein [Amycolatopsis sp. FBCC-B4732]UOX91969.1 SH3 domain-containing protein [Amycolatopsis sp. FBCC-B4732]
MRIRIGKRVAGVAGIAAAIALAGATPALAATGTVHTDSGIALTVRSTPSTGGSAVGTIADGTAVTISCQTNGSTVDGKYGTSDIWDKVGDGYISDAYVYTGSDGRVAPDCAGSTLSCTTAGTGNPKTCAQAVAYAKTRVHTNDLDSYEGWCDRINAQNYGWTASGSETAYIHWTQIPASFKHPGDTQVPAGGLAFFKSSGAGHTMISIGGGKFLSNDINGYGSYTETTIAQIKSKWGQTYLGWSQPWFKVNH